MLEDYYFGMKNYHIWWMDWRDEVLFWKTCMLKT